MITEADLILPADKGTHFIAGAIVFLLVVVFTGLPHLAMLLTFVVGAGKEASDALLNRREQDHGEAPTHDPSFLDFAATCAGGLVPYLSVLAS